MRRQKMNAHREGFVRTVLKRKRRLIDINSSDFKMKAYNERLALNAPIQGCKNFETPIITKEHGLVQLGEVVNQSLEVWDGERFVHALCLPSGEKQEVIITFSDNRKVVCSPNHKFLCKNSQGKSQFKTPAEFSLNRNNPQMVVFNSHEVEDFNCISLGDFPIVSSKTWNTNNYDFAQIEDPFELGYLLGWLKSDGTVNPNKDCGFLFAENKFAIRDYIVPILRRYFPTVSKHVRLPEKNRTQILEKYLISSVILAKQADIMKVKTRIPAVVFKSKEALHGYIQACIDADGTVTEDNVALSLGKRNFYETFAREFQQALSVFGIAARLHFCEDRINVIIRKNAVSQYARLIGSKHPVKAEKLKAFASVPSKVYGDTIRVKSVEFTDNRIFMFDIVNSDSGMFVADGIITHNSAADITSSAQIRIDNDSWFAEHGCYMLIQVHDELVFECPEEYVEEAIERIKHYFKFPFGDDIIFAPTLESEADFGDNYGQAK